MPYENNAFCWNGVVSADPERAAAFYEATIGWTAYEHTFEDGSGGTMLAAGDVPRAHLREPEMEGEGSRWVSYLRVEDVNATTDASTAAGGRVLIPPTDVPPGRFSMVVGPSGVPLCFYHEADEDEAANPPPGPGSVTWTELHSTDVDADVEWLKASVGFEIQEMPISGGTYYLLSSGGETRGGAVAAHTDDVAGRWLTWIHVEDVDETVERIVEHGGRAVTEPSDYPDVGRMAIAEDPTGGVFGVMTPAQ